MDEDEEIEVKPAIDNIPDEYFVGDNCTKIHVHLFSISNSEAKNKVDCFKETLPEDGYILFDHSLESDNCKDLLNDIVESSKNARGIILFFCGKSNTDGQLKMYDGETEQYYVLHDIWTKFYIKNCLHLKNKPKIFIFEVTVIQFVESDGIRKAPPPHELRYDTPNEADIFILYHKSRDDGGDDYIENFCENIRVYGKSEDITALATCVARPLHVPMLISTLTKKFYFLYNNYRGHNHYITEKKNMLSSEMTSIKTIVTKKQPEGNTLRKSFLKFFRNGSNLSDKVKGKDQKEKCVEQDKVSQKESKEGEKKRHVLKKDLSKSEKEKDKKYVTNSKVKSGPSVSSESKNVEKFPLTAKASTSSLTESRVVKPRTKSTDILKERRKSRTVSTASDDSKGGPTNPPWKY